MASSAGILASSVEVKLDRADRTYLPGEQVKGLVVLKTHHERMGFNSIKLFVEGSTKLHLNAKNVGLFEAFYSTIEPQILFSKTIQVCGPGQASRGETEFAFQFNLTQEKTSATSVDVKRFFDTYHGVYINTDYIIRVEVTRGLLSTNLTRDFEFIVQVPTTPTDIPKPENIKATSFLLAPETLENVSQEELKHVPRFRISGLIHRLICPVTEPFTGEVMVEESELPIASVEVQLVRLESVTYAEGVVQEATEVQNLQIVDGDVTKNFAIPIFMVFPRLFTCPTMVSEQFMVEFEVNLTVLFQDGTLLTENFPLQLYRPQSNRSHSL